MKKAACFYVFLMLATVVMLLMSSCNETRRTTRTDTVADSLMEAASRARHYEQLLQLADSLEASHDLSAVRANYWRGYTYYHLRQTRTAEIYWEKVLAADVRGGDADFIYYATSASRLANLLMMKGDYESTLKVALPVTLEMEVAGRDTLSDYANLLTAIGGCQLNTGNTKDAAKNYEQSYQHMQQALVNDKTGTAYKGGVIGMIKITDSYLNVQQYDEARKWLDRYEELLNSYEQHPKASKAFIDKERARLYFYRATAQQGLGYPKEAAKAYKAALTTNYAKTGDGQIEATTYLMAAKRWSEAANNFRILDQQHGKYHMAWSLDHIQRYLLPKYRANLGAHRRDTTIAVGSQLCALLDSAIAWQKRDDAAELAVIYDTQQKEAQIIQQQAYMTQQRLISTGVALVLLVVFFTAYTLYRRKATHRLAIAHEKLQVAYDQLETTTKAKERFESELRIARDIQMSMVPRVFPNHEGLDIYASMVPAREVGGDLYDYLLKGDLLYFCVGDVSGKGVPASLFMAQAIRLFRSIAKQGHSPATIATRINNELTEDNEQGMFVTMFIGLIDLTTGQLKFCNAGHNPPVLGYDGHDELMQMEPNAPIGLWPDIKYVGETIDNIQNRLLLVYTDGLNEAENNQQELFSEERLLDILNSRHFDTARELVEYLNAEIERHRGGALPNDDLTMLCLFVK